MVASLIMLHLYNKIPRESTTIIKDKLAKLDKLGLAKIVLRLPLVKLYNIEIVFWVGAVLLGIFGIGRFMIGDRLLGVLKVLLLGISYSTMLAATILTEFTEHGEIAKILLIAGYAGIVLCVIWWIIDIFLIEPKARRKNLNKILMAFQLEK